MLPRNRNRSSLAWATAVSKCFNGGYSSRTTGDEGVCLISSLQCHYPLKSQGIYNKMFINQTCSWIVRRICDLNEAQRKTHVRSIIQRDATWKIYLRSVISKDLTTNWGPESIIRVDPTIDALSSETMYTGVFTSVNGTKLYYDVSSHSIPQTIIANYNKCFSKPNVMTKIK